MQVTLEMPDQVARQWGETPDAIGRHVMGDAAIEGSGLLIPWKLVGPYRLKNQA